MKKQFLFIVASIFTMLFAACSQENELDTLGGEKSNLVSVSTQLPADFAKTRALPGAADHQLRCILEVWSTGENVKLISRHEKLADAGADKISFTFEVEPATYNCLMWADFVASGATATEKTKGSVTYQGYKDKFYTTEKLDAVVVENVNDLFNTEACDAFFGTKELVKEATAATLAASLTRPFAKLTIKEKDAESYAKCTSLTVGYKVPNTFNVKRGTVSGEADATYTGVPAGSSVYFTHYILASDEALGNIPMTFTTADQTVEKVIPAGVPIKRNHRTNAAGSFIPKVAKPGEATVDISIGNDWLDDDQEVNPGDPTPPAKLAVGDFYYSDGSYSTDLNSGKTCVGIVFAVGAQQGDAIGNYTGTGLTGEIKGYVLAVKDFDYDDKNEAATAKGTKHNNAEGAMPGVIPALFAQEGSYNDTDFLGYKYTQALMTWNDANEATSITKIPSIEQLIRFIAKSKVPEATSGWYIPSAGQLAVILTKYDSPEENIIKTNLATLETIFDEGKNTLYFAKGRTLTISTGSNSYLSSSINKDATKIYGADFKKTSYKIVPNKTPNASSYLRAILTF